MCFQSSIAAAQGTASRLNGWLAAAALIVLLAVQPALASGPQRPAPAQGVICDTADARGVQRCTVGLDERRMALLAQSQRESQWCWAASIAMVFAGAGFQVSQEDVVRAHFGELLDQPVRGRDITDLLNRTWRDAAGRAFAAQALGRRAGQDLRAVTQEILGELEAGRLMVIGVGSHAVVLARVRFERFTRERAVRIVGFDVLDPAPGAGVRSLDPATMRPTYVAMVKVGTPPAVTEPDSGEAALSLADAEAEARDALLLAGRGSVRARRR